jgi:glucose/mannose-6-phosphate isomerase
MDLNLYEEFKKLDAENMYAHIFGLPDQLESAYKQGLAFPFTEYTGIKKICVAGMGGSAIGADLLAAYAQTQCVAPIFVHRDYDLPAWVSGEDTLLICSSHSGNTEETLSAFKAGLGRGCQILIVCTGGKLAAAGREHGVPVWQFEHQGQPRAAVGLSFGLLLAALVRMKLMPDSQADVLDTANEMRAMRLEMGAEQPVVKNPAKRLAGQLVGRWVVVMASGYLAPVARRWKGQISELAKAWAQFEYLPEADHNTLAGVVNPPDLFNQMVALFLEAPSDHPRNHLRSSFTRLAFMQDGLGTDTITARGRTPLAHIWTSLYYGDFAAYYLAILYGIDPTPIAALLELKKFLEVQK